MTTPLVSIIMPLFNAEKYIAESIDSVLFQSYSAWELIIVDDLSSDNSLNIAKEYLRKDDRIKLLKRETSIKGGAVCRNIGINNSRGEYIVFLDSDDLLEKNCLENRVKFMEANPNLDFSVFQMQVISPEGNKKNEYLTHLRDNYLYAFLSNDLPWQTTCPIWRSKFVKEVLIGFSEEFPRFQDPEFHTRALLDNRVLFVVNNSANNTDCYYRVGYKKVSISVILRGAELYITSIRKLIIDRSDFIVCKEKLALFWDDIVDIYTKSSIEEMKDNSHKIISINKKNTAQEIISFKKGIKISMFAYLVKCNLLNYSVIRNALNLFGLKNFYSYKI